jgi:hypothetical protein
MSEPAAIEILDEDSSAELVPYEPHVPATLWGNDPKIALQRMSEDAEALMHVVRSQDLAVRVRGREFLKVEAWTTLGALKGVHAAIVWTRANETGDGIIARAEARTLEGVLVGAAESECSRTESKWKNSDAFAIRSMAQTRAISRALQAPLRHIAVLAGYEGAAAEEVPPEPDSPTPAEEPTAEQKAEIKTLLRTLDHADPAIDWQARAREHAGASSQALTRTGAEMLIEKLQGELAELVPKDEAGE